MAAALAVAVLLAHRLLSNRIVDPFPRSPSGDRRLPSDDLRRPVEPPLRPGGEPSASPSPPAVPPTAAPSAPPASRSLLPPRVALILDDVGLDLDLVRAAAGRLPPAVAYAVLPGLPHSRAASEFLSDGGFTLLCHLPMEPDDPEKEQSASPVIRPGLGDADLDAALAANLDGVPGAVGVNNHQGSRATRDEALMARLLGRLRERGLFFVDSRTTGGSVAGTVARRLGLPGASRDVFLDDDPAPEAVERQFDRLLLEARVRGRALGIGHLREETIGVLEARLARLPGDGVVLVRLDDYVRRGRPPERAATSAR